MPLVKIEFSTPEGLHCYNYKNGETCKYLDIVKSKCHLFSLVLRLESVLLGGKSSVKIQQCLDSEVKENLVIEKEEIELGRRIRI